MRGDFSRIRLSKGKGYTSVLEQQGRVALDADANEQRYLDDAVRRTETVDVIGTWGGPAGDEGFAIDPSSGAIVIGAGRYYVNGLLCENPASVSYEDQQFLAVPAGSSAALLDELPGGQGVVQVWLQAWQRLVTALDDPCLREPALGQADTTARLQTVWRVVARFEDMDLGQVTGPFCPALYGNEPAASTGTLTVATGAASADCGCGPVPAAGYAGIENQLYRVEIQAGGDASAATFKWSRENGSVVAAVAAVTGATVRVDSLGPDANLGFGVGQWVELTDDTLTFGPAPNVPGPLYLIQSIDKDDLSVTLTTPVAGLDVTRNARMRRWDQSGPSAGASGVTVVTGTPAELENGIQVTFGAGTYQAGDYWTFPARTATGAVEWPPCDSDGQPAQPPASVVVHEAPLAVLYWERGAGPAERAEAAARPARPTFGNGHGPVGHVVNEDCRMTFRPLTPPAAVHVQSLSWANDDLLPVDVLAADGLVVTLDQAVAGPADGGSFIVTLEPNAPQDKETAGIAIRTPYILDSAVTVAGRQLTWEPPPQPALGYIGDLLGAGSQTAERTRVRVRLLGQAVFTASATGAAGPAYLDGRALGQPGTRADGVTPRVDLRFPSGDGSLASDLESWFYLMPPLAATGVTLPSGAAYTAQDGANGAFEGVVPTGSAGVTPVDEIAAIVTLSYPAAAGTALGASLTTLTTVGGTPIATVPAAVTILPGEQSVTVPVTISGAPAPGAVDSFTLTATVTVAGGFQASAPSVTATFTVSAAPGQKPPPPAPA
jgi:Family of unknown function (DUF6519)